MTVPSLSPTGCFPVHPGVVRSWALNHVGQTCGGLGTRPCYSLHLCRGDGFWDGFCETVTTMNTEYFQPTPPSNPISINIHSLLPSYFLLQPYAATNFLFVSIDSHPLGISCK